METVNEGSTAYLVATFLNKAGVAEAPETITYTVHDVYTGTVLRASTGVTPAATIEIALAPTDNGILNAVHPREERRVTITALFGVGAVQKSEYVYWVKNLAHVVG